MVAGCGAKCAKYLLIAFNVVFFIAGAALLAIGIWLRVDPNITQKLDIVGSGEDKLFEYACYVLIAFGAFVLIIAFCGCCGAIRESKCLLGTYIVLLVLVIMGEIAAAVLGFLYRSKLEEALKEGTKGRLVSDDYASKKDGELAYTAFGVGMNLVQQEFQCCGIDGPTDYTANSAILGVFGQAYPYACCKNIEGGKERPTKPTAACDLNAKGCLKEFKSWIDKHIIIIIGIAIGIACLEIFGLIFAICVCRVAGTDDYA